MAFPVKSNSLLPLLAGVAVVFLIVVLGTALFDDGPDTIDARLPSALAPSGIETDADTSSDTLKAIQGQLEAISDEVVSSGDKMDAEMATQTFQLREEIESDFTGRLDAITTEQRSAEQRTKEEFNRRFAGLEALINNLAADRSSVAPIEVEPVEPSVNGDLPIGLGLQTPSHDGYIWVASLGEPVQPIDGVSDGSPFIPTSTVAPGQPFAGAATPVQSPANQGPALTESPPDRPFLTIPNLATLVGSRSFTAMIGRVPIGGTVRDPVPFRVLVGRENLAASGLRVPDEIVSMVFEGVAVGDWTLSCVEGSLHTATFIFEDGTIRTVSQGAQSSVVDARQDRLGYITDRFGTPCIPGERVSNAKSYLAGRIGLRAAGAAAQAAAASETTTVVGSATGAVTNSVTGNTGQFILGRTLADGLDEVDQYFEERLNDTFDAIFVEAGKEVAILIQHEIAIDYTPEGRRLSHVGNQSGLRRARLD